MTDIFISYARADQTVARRLAQRFEKRGATVWFDAGLGAGDDFRDEIDRQIRRARGVVVIWSAAARDSDWVLDEAKQALDLGKLYHATLDGRPQPHGYGRARHHVVSLIHPDSEEWDAHADRFVRDVLAKIRGLPRRSVLGRKASWLGRLAWRAAPPVLVAVGGAFFVCHVMQDDNAICRFIEDALGPSLCLATTLDGPALISAIQIELERLGCLSGAVDGEMGPQTQAAMATCRARFGIDVQGGATNALLCALRAVPLPESRCQIRIRHGLADLLVEPRQFARVLRNVPSGRYTVLADRLVTYVNRPELYVKIRVDGTAGWLHASNWAVAERSGTCP